MDAIAITAPPTSAPSSTSIWIPTPTDDSSYERKGSTNSSGLKKYYFAFLGIAIVIAALVVVLLLRRTRKRRMDLLRQEREVDLENYRSSRDAEGSPDIREEGLDEHGEAPPPYAPPPTTNEEMDSRTNRNELVVPPPTLSRYDAGLKPPEYSEVPTRSP